MLALPPPWAGRAPRVVPRLSRGCPVPIPTPSLLSPVGWSFRYLYGFSAFSAGGGTTAPAHNDVETKASMFQACKHSMVVSVMFLSDDTNEKISLIVHFCTCKVMEFHTSQVLQRKDADGCEKISRMLAAARSWSS